MVLVGSYTVLALIIQTAYIIILFLSNSLNMLHLGISYPFYSTERPYTSTITQLAGKENAKVTFTTTNQDLRVSHDRHSATCSCNGSICTMMNVYRAASSLLC